MILPTTFYKQDTITLAQSLLGCFLVSKSKEGLCVGRIVETEAYLSENDPACHAHRGKTDRNEAMFGAAGTAYVYQIYGMHLCFNVVSGAQGLGEAVLIRALEPWRGIPLMERRRNAARLARAHNTGRHLATRELCRGPAKLTTALGISLAHNQTNLRTGPISLHAGTSFPRKRPDEGSSSILSSPRIGISKAEDLPLRFYFAQNRFVSGPSRSTAFSPK